MAVVDIARSFIGERETKGNKFEGDTEFERLIKEAGHLDGEAWCCLAAEVVFKKALPHLHKTLDKLFSKNCMQTYRNFVKAGYKVSQEPVVGALVIWCKMVNGKETEKGHAGVCTKALDKIFFWSVEGNTNAAGGREGEVMAEKTTRSTRKVKNGLQVKGFIIIEP